MTTKAQRHLASMLVLDLINGVLETASASAKAAAAAKAAEREQLAGSSSAMIAAAAARGALQGHAELSDAREMPGLVQQQEGHAAGKASSV